MWRACGPPAPVRSAVLACALLLLAAPAHAAPKDDGICPSLDIRNQPDQFHKLKGCRIIEGQLSIVLMERATAKVYENMSFPELREVTGYILIYRTKGVKNLGDLFPNLTVVRGMELFKDFALVIFDNVHLEALGLRSLMAVQKGGVRIERNDRLCYVNTIDWSRIITDGSENIIKSNYDTRFCGLCPNAKSRIKDNLESTQCPTAEPDKRLLCWDENNCQQEACPAACGVQGCLKNKTCCHSACLGGCDGITAHDCKVCRNFSFGDGPKRVCVASCPKGTYELFSRCVSETQCREMPPPPPAPQYSGSGRFATRLNYYKITDNKKCEFMCPPGYMEQGNNSSNALCVPCKDIGGCFRECDADVKIDSVATARQYTGCTHIKGKLEISIRAGGGNTLVELEKSLGEIRQITGSLQVTRSYPLVSFMFLKNLKTIVGDKNISEARGQVLHILNNPNLELLWDWNTHGALNISGGTIYIHLNPKLCYNQLLPLKNMTSNPRSNFTDIEVSADSNGNQASCLPGVLELAVTELRDTAAVLSWSTYCPDDIRRLLGYSLYYMPANTNVTLYEQRDACSDSWNILDISITETALNTTEVTKTDNVFKICNDLRLQPMFSPLSSLVPYTRYAAYVKTYTTLQDKKGAQSRVIYFTTLPARPSPPQNLGVEHLSPHSVHIRWSPPAMPNGTIILYHVEVQANSYNRDQILAGRHSSKETCSNPTALANLIASRVEEAQETEEEKVTGDVNNDSCACKEEPRPTLRFSVRAEEERMDSIHFENDLQNLVYKKNSERSKPKNPASRIKRSVDRSLNTMLVKLTKNIQPKPGANYTNSTDVQCSYAEPKVCIVKENDTDYVKSLYYELDGKALSVDVTGMRHFTWYTVSVWACRAQAENETKEKYDEIWCSERQFYTFLTLEMPNADTVSNVRAHLGNSNKTNDVNVTWDPPINPNGFVVAYSVTYTKIQEDNTASPYQNCVPAGETEPIHGHLIRGLNPGNYSIRVTPITVRGPGNSSAEVYIDIPPLKQPASYDWVWGVVGGCLVMILVLTGVIWYVKRGLLSPTEAHKLFASVNPEYVSTVYVPDEWEVSRANIEFIRELGQGSFGMVYEGIAKDLEKGKPETRCAVKTVNEHATDRERIEFLNEASVMKAFDTFHVVRLLGVVSRGQPTLVVMELMESGDLKTYLRSHRPDADSSLPKKEPRNNPPTLQNILQMAIEIADGMAYLSAKKFVHRDLAARNCMVAGDLTVKVGDFGMTRDIYETDYYRKGGRGLLPVRWMSPESLKDGVFSSSSDAWSYGVVLWEMATLAMQPYQGLSNEQVVRYVVEGGVMERPEHCPDRLYELMRACWAHRPGARPSFLQLVADLAPNAQPYFRHRSFFHSPLGQELYALQRTAMEEEVEVPEVNVGAVATGSGSNLFGVSGRLASWVRELSSLRSRASDDAAAEPLQPLAAHPPLPVAQPLKGPNGVLRDTTQP